MDLESILSTPIRFNKILNTKFDPEISQAGFNYFKDLFPENRPVNNFNELRNGKIRKIRTMINRVPQTWLLKIIQMPPKCIAVIPRLIVNINGKGQCLAFIPSDTIYEKLIESKIKPPTGLRHWFELFDLSESDIRLGFTHARVSSKSSFDHAFQYKIMTQILPTNQYLARYRIRDSNICEKCHLSVDTILHCLYQCQLVVPFVDRISDFLRIQCNFQENIDSLQYFFGFKNNIAVNHIVLELKKELFYNWDSTVDVGIFLERFVAKIRKIMIIEKKCIKTDKMFNQYSKKWNEFIVIYDFRGPDPSIF